MGVMVVDWATKQKKADMYVSMPSTVPRGSYEAV